jgi:beta-lactamase class A
MHRLHNREKARRDDEQHDDVDIAMTVTQEIKKITIARSLLLIFLAGALAIGIFIGAGVNMFTPLPAAKTEGAPERTEGTFNFIRSSVESKSTGGTRARKELTPFQYKVKALIDSKVEHHEAVTISVYFRDLNNGNSFGIGERDKFVQKSLLKLPLMIAYFRWAEANPLVLRKTLTCTGNAAGAEQGQHGGPREKLEVGKAFTVNDLIYRMIAHDDAVAYAMLYANLPAGRLDKIFKDLYVEYDPQKQEDTLSLSAFAAFYRILFNASYLSEEMSEKALRYLSKSSFRDGMASGIPPTIDIASKHGESTISIPSGDESTELYQLHEFGIIYYPNRPFLLGIMARGEDFDQLVKVIRDITRQVYEEVDRQS